MADEFDIDVPPSSGTPEKPTQIGQRLRAIRESQRLSLTDLAHASGLTKSWVSKIERDQAQASVASLIRLCAALGVQVGTLFESEAGDLVRAGEYPRINFGGEGLDEYLLTPAKEQRLQAILSEIEPRGGSGAEFYSLPSDVEFAIVLHGSLSLCLDGDELHLGEGDALTFSASTRHTFLNPSATDSTRVLWVVSPALPSGQPYRSTSAETP